MLFVSIVLYLLCALVIVATALPIWRTSRWWVRLCDFPRFQIALLAMALIASTLVLHWPLTTFETGLLIAVGVACFWQLSWIWRYLPCAPVEVQKSTSRQDAHCVSLLTTNVLQSSKDSESLLKIVADADPDILLAVETDEWWCSRLSDGLSSRYPHCISYPLSNGYGLTLFSRLELVEPSVRFLIDEAIPSIKTSVRLRSGSVIDLYGLHPQPPAPLQDSAQRDTELLVVASEISRTRRPAIVLGDLNDVAWSPTTARFKRVGGLLDPRRGRGFFNTYPAALPGLRYPLDYVFHSPHFTIQKMRVLPRFASDHLPLLVVLCPGLTPSS
jgi:endonuclease/exonuclease/phosphatase (EEP) superfamily protein YafD